MKDQVLLEDALEFIGPGWSDLVREIYKAKPDGIEIVQVKEKFAILRVYMEPYDEEFQKFIDIKEIQSSFICELCGKLGGPDPKATGWMRTRCPQHYGISMAEWNRA